MNGPTGRDHFDIHRPLCGMMAECKGISASKKGQQTQIEIHLSQHGSGGGHLSICWPGCRKAGYYLLVVATVL
jgi:hypothetical protein